MLTFFLKQNLGTTDDFETRIHLFPYLFYLKNNLCEICEIEMYSKVSFCMQLYGLDNVLGIQNFYPIVCSITCQNCPRGDTPLFTGNLTAKRLIVYSHIFENIDVDGGLPYICVYPIS